MRRQLPPCACLVLAMPTMACTLLHMLIMSLLADPLISNLDYQLISLLLECIHMNLLRQFEMNQFLRGDCYFTYTVVCLVLCVMYLYASALFIARLLHLIIPPILRFNLIVVFT
jgi:hypothetical protein